MLTLLGLSTSISDAATTPIFRRNPTGDARRGQWVVMAHTLTHVWDCLTRQAIKGW